MFSFQKANLELKQIAVNRNLSRCVSGEGCLKAWVSYVRTNGCQTAFMYAQVKYIPWFHSAATFLAGL